MPDLNPSQGILPLHWANILHRNPEKNGDVVQAWVKKINRTIEENDLVPVRDIVQFLTQFLNMNRTKIYRHRNTLVVDMDWIHKVPASVLGEFVFFSVNTSSPIDILGSEKFPSIPPREAGFLKLGLPKSGKIIFQFSRKR